MKVLDELERRAKLGAANPKTILALVEVVRAAEALITKATGDDGLTHTDELSGADMDALQAALAKLEGIKP